MRKQKIKVRFISHNLKFYNYLNILEEKVEKGETVVVETQYGPQSAIVVDDNVLDPDFKAKKYVICTVKFEELDEKKVLLNKIENLELKIEDRVRSIVHQQMLEEYAIKDSELAKLISDLKILTN